MSRDVSLTVRRHTSCHRGASDTLVNSELCQSARTAATRRAAAQQREERGGRRGGRGLHCPTCRAEGGATGSAERATSGCARAPSGGEPASLHPDETRWPGCPAGSSRYRRAAPRGDGRRRPAPGSRGGQGRALRRFRCAGAGPRGAGPLPGLPYPSAGAEPPPGPAAVGLNESRAPGRARPSPPLPPRSGGVRGRRGSDRGLPVGRGRPARARPLPSRCPPGRRPAALPGFGARAAPGAAPFRCATGSAQERPAGPAGETRSVLPCGLRQSEAATCAPSCRLVWPRRADAGGSAMRFEFCLPSSAFGFGCFQLHLGGNCSLARTREVTRHRRRELRCNAVRPADRLLL